MIPRSSRLAVLAAIPFAAAVALASSPAGARESWSQWGGPTRDFKAPAGKLAESWPENGPEVRWRRPLGPGYSSILVEDGRLYTQFGSAAEEVVIALDAGSGETLWERRYPPGPHAGAQHYGEGPRSTPLIVGARLFAVGAAGLFQALDKATGAVVWSHDLWGDAFRGNVLGHGYSSSPVAFQDTVIVPVGGPGAGLVAFDQGTGEVRWKSTDLENSYSSPRIVEIVGEVQLVVFMAQELVGIDPSSGELRWCYAHRNQWNHNITMPTLGADGTLFLSSPQAGARGLRLLRDGAAIEVRELWRSRRVQFYNVSVVQRGDWVYGSTGTMSPAFLTAIDIRTGEIGWRRRGIAKANCLEADGRLVILDEDGVLYLSTATPEGLELHGKTQLLERVAWTVPTIVGESLYARDNAEIVAVKLR